MIMATVREVEYMAMENRGGDRLLTGAQFRARREAVCPDRQVFSRVAGIPIRTVAAYENGETHRPHEYGRFMDTLGRFERGEVTDRTELPVENEDVEEVDALPGITFSMRAKDHANLGDYRRAREIMRRVLREIEGKA